MPPKESDALLEDSKVSYYDNEESMTSEVGGVETVTVASGICFRVLGLVIVAAVAAGFVAKDLALNSDSALGTKLRAKLHSMAEDLASQTEPIYKLNGTGPYKLVEAHKGKSFFDFYTFFDGSDSLGSAGYNTYVAREKAEALGIARVVEEGGNEIVEISSRATDEYDDWGNRPRDSVRLEGNLRFNDGLVLLDVLEMPTGCGMWPAFWTTDGEVWPDHGEIDIVEPVNTQTIAKTILHTADKCDMYAHVPRWEWTGSWDSTTGLPEFSTGLPDYDTKLETDNCYIAAPHQWLNQGCAAIAPNDGTLGAPMNEQFDPVTKETGGIYAMEWDPNGGEYEGAGFIRSWVFPRSEGIPENLQEALDSNGAIRPDPSSWPTPYAFFPLGTGAGCSNDHFQNHNIIINIAICGTVGGNRFAKDCPALFEKYNVNNDSVATCNAYVDSEEGRAMLEDIKWKIKGVHVFQREDE